MKKRRTYCAICFWGLLVLLLTGCMSEEEKAKAKEHEKEAMPLISTYLENHYGGGKITQLSCQTRKSSSVAVPDFRAYATEYVRAEVKGQGKEFSVLANVETGQCYDNFFYQEIKAELKSLILKYARLKEPKAMELALLSKTLKETLSEGKINGFMAEGLQSFDDLKNSGDYEIYVVLKYIDEVDTEKIISGVLQRKLNGADVSIAVLDYRNQERYVPDQYAQTTFDTDSFADQDSCYRLSDLYILQNGEEYSAAYKSRKIQDIEYIWNPAQANLTFSAIPCEEEMITPYYSGAVFKAVSPTAVQIECENIPYQETSYDGSTAEKYNLKVYCYFPPSRYREQVVVTEESLADIDYDVWTLDWKNDDYIYRWFTSYGESVTVTMGYYERQEEESTEK